MKISSAARTILILASNPTNETRLQLDKEIRQIDEGLRRSRNRDRFRLEQRWAVRPEDLRRSLLDVEPQIVHFCGHGVGEEGLIFEDQAGQSRLISTEALADFFKLFAGKVECVVLNACYSEVQADAIACHINYVIGMNQAIGDGAAIQFTTGFYDALGAGRSIEEAYRFGCSAIQLEGIPEHLTPVLKRQIQNSIVGEEQQQVEKAGNGAEMNSGDMRDFFISYNRNDRQWAEWLAWTLEEAGFTVYIEAWDFRPGGNFVLEMQRAAARTQKTIAVLSDNYLKAEYTHPEWAAAFARDPQGRERSLVPVKVDECQPSGLLNQVIYTSLLNLSREEARAVLLGAFSDRAKPNKEPSFPSERRIRETGKVEYPGSHSERSLPTAREITDKDLKKITPAERAKLIRNLYSLPTEQFNILLFVLDPPRGSISPMPARQADRTVQLLDWAASYNGCGLRIIQETIVALLS